MSFTSFSFLIFLPIALGIYYILPNSVKYIWLLIVSFAFYGSIDPVYLIWLAISIVITYACTRMMGISEAGGRKSSDRTVFEKTSPEKPDKDIKKTNIKKLYFAMGLAACILMLGFFKYAGKTGIAGLNSIVLPAGMSFYMFQAVGYLIDVYKGKTEPESNIIKYALFVSFFPNIVSGPIERAGHFLKQIDEMGKRRIWNYEGFVRGFMTILWGYFLKIVIADRMAVFVNSIFDNYGEYGTIILGGAAVAYSIQIYADFAGYSLVAIGIAKMMGIEIITNFNTPYFATSIKDFWGRWHISLSTWLRDYVYIPLGGSRCSKAKNYLNLMITFLVSGIWHGSGLNFVFWGGLHGVYQVAGKSSAGLRKNIAEKLHINADSKLIKLLKMLVTFAIVTLAWIFFRVPTLTDGIRFVGRIFTSPDISYIMQNGIHDIGFDNRDVLGLVVAFAVSLIVAVYRYRTGVQQDEFFWKRALPIRWAWMLFLIFGIIILGKYGPGTYSQPFVYSQF